MSLIVHVKLITQNKPKYHSPSGRGIIMLKNNCLPWSGIETAKLIDHSGTHSVINRIYDYFLVVNTHTKKFKYFCLVIKRAPSFKLVSLYLLYDFVHVPLDNAKAALGKIYSPLMFAASPHLAHSGHLRVTHFFTWFISEILTLTSHSKFTLYMSSCNTHMSPSCLVLL